MKNKNISALLSLLFPGIGHFYIGKHLDALVILITAISLWLVGLSSDTHLLTFDNYRSFLVWGGLVFIYLYSFIDAYRKTKQAYEVKNANQTKGISVKFLFLSFVPIIVLLSGFYLWQRLQFSHPKKHKLNVVPVLGSEETKKHGFRVGGWCWLGGATMLLKNNDPSITFDKVLLYKEGGTSFSLIFMGGNKQLFGSEYHFSTDSQMRAAKNLGYKAHLRIKNPLIVLGGEQWQIKNWIKNAKQMRADVKTFFLTPINEIKYMVSQGYPVFTDSIPCGKDFNVIEGFEKNNLYVITPEPFEFGLIDPKGTCMVPFPNFYRILWYTKEWDAKSDAELLSLLKWHAQLAPINMRAFVTFMQADKNMDISITFNQLYVVRNVAANFLEKLGHKDLAKGYRQSAQLMAKVNFPAEKQGQRRTEITNALQKIADLEESFYPKWPSPVVSKKTDYLEYAGLLITANKKTDITITSAKQNIPSAQLIYEVYDITTSGPIDLTFKYGVYLPANLIKGKLQVVKLENNNLTHINSEDHSDGTDSTITARINESGKYALILYPEPEVKN